MDLPFSGSGGAAARGVRLAKADRIRFWSGFGLVPEAVHLGQIALFKGLPAILELVLDKFETGAEFAVGALQSGFRFDVQAPGEVDHDEKQIADLLFDI